MLRLPQWVHYRLNGIVGDDKQLKEEIDSTVSKQLTVPKVCFFSKSYNDDILFNRPSLPS
jgi:hypothetical protein